MLKKFIDNRLNWENKCFIGDPGTGKSHALQHLINATAYDRYLALAGRNELKSERENVHIFYNNYSREPQGFDQGDFFRQPPQISAAQKTVIIVDGIYSLKSSDYELLKERMTTPGVKVWLAAQSIQQFETILKKQMLSFFKNFDSFHLGYAHYVPYLTVEFQEKIRRLPQYYFKKTTYTLLFDELEKRIENAVLAESAASIAEKRCDH